MDTLVPDEANDPLCGKEVANGRYLVERVLGKGGMGTVYAAL
jgi:serine/threonine protein kinase